MEFYVSSFPPSGLAEAVPYKVIVSEMIGILEEIWFVVIRHYALTDRDIDLFRKDITE